MGENLSGEEQLREGREVATYLLAYQWSRKIKILGGPNPTNSSIDQ